MTRQEIIQALRDNREHFVCMPVPWQKTAEDIGPEHFESLSVDSDCRTETWNEVAKGDGCFYRSLIYRLRATYKEPETDKPEMKPVTSSNIEAVGYDDIALNLHVKFKGNEAIYIYKEVSRDKYDEMMASGSIGKFMHAEIKGKYIVDKQ